MSPLQKELRKAHESYKGRISSQAQAGFNEVRKQSHEKNESNKDYVRRSIKYDVNMDDCLGRCLSGNCCIMGVYHNNGGESALLPKLAGGAKRC